MLRSIRRRRNMRPAGMTRQAKLSLPMRDSNSRFWHFLRDDEDLRSARSSLSLSSGRAVHEICNHVIVFENLFKGIGETVKKVWRRAQAKG